MPNKQSKSKSQSEDKSKPIAIDSAQVTAVMAAIGRIGGLSRSKRKAAAGRKNAAKATAVRMQRFRERKKLEKLQEKNGKGR